MQGTLFLIIVFFMTIFLNQSSVIFGINISFSDLFSILALLILLFRKQLKIVFLPTAFFVLLIVYTLFSTFIYVPYRFLYFPHVSSVMVNVIKLLVVFVYFILGYNLSHIKLEEKAVKWFSMAALVIGFIGVIYTILSIRPFSSTLFYGGVRLRGFMNDPNYFAILQVAAFGYFTRKSDLPSYQKYGFPMIIIFSVLASGSKTGLTTLLSYLLLRVFESLRYRKITAKQLLLHTASAIAIILMLFNISAIERVFERLGSVIPAFNRIQEMFVNFNSAVSGKGSARDTAWGVALELIQLSPVMGVGLGTYSGIARQLFDTTIIAHNTYLQLFSEWGLFLAGALFLYIFYLISKVTCSINHYPKISLVIRDMILIFMIGSLGISLNNARMFWVFFGMFHCITRTPIQGS